MENYMDLSHSLHERMRSTKGGGEFESIKQSRRVLMTKGNQNQDNSGDDDLNFVRSLTQHSALSSSNSTQEDPYQPGTKQPELPTKQLGSVIRKVLSIEREPNSRPKNLFNTLSTFKGAKITFLQISPDNLRILLCQNNKTITVYDCETYKSSSRTFEEQPTFIKFIPGSAYAMVGFKKEIKHVHS